MGGIFGVVSNGNCVEDLFYGTDYHSHLGTMFGGLAIKNGNGFQRHIHDISGSQFRSELSDDVRDSSGHEGIGVISDTDPQPLIPHSHLGEYAIVTVGRINNLAEIAEDAFRRGIHMLDRSGGLMNPTEAVGCLIDQGRTFEEGIANAQNVIKGSCSMLVLTEQGLYASRDKLGRTPLIIGKKDGAIAVASETTSFPNLGRGFSIEHYLGPGEVVLIPTWNSFVQKKAPEKSMQVCSFLWVYYGYPSSHYEGLNVEIIREQ
jgi:amidophosphoribosyltransferase